MKSFEYTIKDELGIHARPAGMLVKEAKNFASECTITKDGKTKKLTQLMMLMSLGVKHRSEWQHTGRRIERRASLWQRSNSRLKKTASTERKCGRS